MMQRRQIRLPASTACRGLTTSSPLSACCPCQVVPSGSEYVVVLQSLGVDWGLDDLSLQPGKCVASCLQTQQQDSGIGEGRAPLT